MICEKGSKWKGTLLGRTIRSCLRIECIIVCLSWVMLVSYADNSNAQRVVASKKHLEPEHRIEFRSGATPSNPLNFNRPYDRIAGYLYKPKGEGRYPAVVLLHDDQAIHRTHIEWAKRLAAWGYVAIAVDTLDRSGSSPTDSPIAVAQDAYGALKHLHSLSFVDPERIAGMGWDLGARAIMSALKANPQQPASPSPLFTKELKYRFKAGIAYHPLCSSVVTTMYAPLLIFVGDKDEYFLKGGCDTFPKENRAGGEPYRITVYPGATSFFDYGETGQDSFQNRIAPDPSATQDSIERVKAFLKEKL
jgi:dienelactone hydrolase